MTTSETAIAIKNKNLFNSVALSTIEQEVSKSNCIYDLVQFHGVEIIDIKEEMIRCLALMNAKLHVNRRLDDYMITEIINTVINDYNSLSIIGFFKAVKHGINGDYGQIYSLDYHTVMGWIQKYMSGEEYLKRIDALRRKSETTKNDELRNMEKGDLLEVMKEALKLTEPKPVEFRSNPAHLESFKQTIKLFSTRELNAAIKDWKKRQRPQYLEILLKEKKTRTVK